MTKISIPTDVAAFEALRRQARVVAGRAPSPKTTTSSTADRKPSPGAPGPKLEGLASEDPRPAAPSSSSDHEQPARIPETPRADEGRKLEPEEPGPGCRRRGPADILCRDFPRASALAVEIRDEVRSR